MKYCTFDVLCCSIFTIFLFIGKLYFYKLLEWNSSRFRSEAHPEFASRPTGSCVFLSNSRMWLRTFLQEKWDWKSCFGELCQERKETAVCSTGWWPLQPQTPRKPAQGTSFTYRDSDVRGFQVLNKNDNIIRKSMSKVLNVVHFFPPLRNFSYQLKCALQA